MLPGFGVKQVEALHLGLEVCGFLGYFQRNFTWFFLDVIVFTIDQRRWEQSKVNSAGSRYKLVGGSTNQGDGLHMGGVRLCRVVPRTGVIVLQAAGLSIEASKHRVRHAIYSSASHGAHANSFEISD